MPEPPVLELDHACCGYHGLMRVAVVCTLYNTLVQVAARVTVVCTCHPGLLQVATVCASTAVA